ncbi:two-component regulator propeller domain-containing protein [Pedobacter petrophilus]|nr:two-component regulator propeller domain-containing protein [Pedobacter petrophilus]
MSKKVLCKTISLVYSRLVFHIYIILFFFANAGIASASYPELKFRVIEKGLSNSKIRCVFQDSKGYIWIGTSYGLSRYDGYQVINYLPDVNNKGSISNSFINGICEDKDHNIWVATGFGLNRFNRNSNTFTRFLYNTKNAGRLSNNNIRTVFVDDKGNLWIGTAGGLNLIQFGKKRIDNYSAYTKEAKNLNGINCIYQASNKTLWVGTDGNGLYQLFGRTWKLFNRSNGISSNFITAICEDKNRDLWVGTKEEGISVINSTKGSVRQFKKNENKLIGLPENEVLCLFKDSKGDFWVGTVNGGLSVYSFTTNSFTHYKSDPFSKTSLPQKSVSAVLEDKQHNFWVATGGGLCVYSPERYKFNLVTALPQSNSLSHKNVKTFYEDKDGLIWIGTDGGGINIWNRKDNTYRVYRNKLGNSSTLGSDAVLHVYKDKQGTIWVATWGGGLNRFNPKTNNFSRFVHQPADTNSIGSDDVCQLFEDSRGQLWVGTAYGGLSVLDRKKGIFRLFKGPINQKTKFEGKSISRIQEDKNGDLWIGTDDAGLYCYSEKNKSLTSYFNPNSNTKISFYEPVDVVFNDSKGRLWIGQNSLMLFDFKTRTFKQPALSAKFGKIIILEIMEDLKGNFWISTNNGLIKYNPDQLFFKRYSEADGLQGLEFSRNSSLKTRDGKMLFGGTQGFNIFHPDSISNSSNVAPVYFTDFQIFNKSVIAFGDNSVLKSPISEAKEVKLAYDQSLFSFDYASLNYIDPEKTQYAYYLEGFDRAWNFVGNQRKATYTNLDPGKYVFKVKARNADGVWGTNEASINVIIVPPFWMTWWFKLSGVLVLMATLIFLLQQRRKVELKKIDEVKKEEIHQSQLQFFTNISHELRTPLTLILGPLQRIMKEGGSETLKNSTQIMYRNGMRLMGLINEIIDFRKAETGVLNLKVTKGNLAQLINDLAADFSEKAIELGINFKVNIPVINEDLWFDKQIIEKIIINLLHNSFKYTPAGETVTIEIFFAIADLKPSFENELILKSNYKAAEYVYIRVADNGIGISKQSMNHLFERYFRITQSHLGSGLGLAFVKTLTFLHKGEIYVYSEKLKGTEISIAIPIGKKEYKLSELWDENNEESTVKLESLEYKNELYFKKDILIKGNLDLALPREAKTLLIVEDNDEIRAFLRECLALHYHIYEAVDGLEGLIKAKEQSPDLILSDVMMPKMDGIELCRLLKEDLETSHIPIILLTANDTPDTKISGVGFGADHYFSKPIDIDLLSLTIKNLFDQRQKIKQRYLKDYKVEVRELVHSAKDKELMDKLLAIIELHMENPDLSVDMICKEIGMSKTKLGTKIKEITGLAIIEFVKNVRLKKAVEIMTCEAVSVGEVMYRVGILSKSYFSTVFKKEYGVSPSQFLLDIDHSIKKGKG